MNYKSTHDLLLESIDFFAGMTGKEIDAYLAQMELFEEFRWRKRWEELQQKSREEDAAYLASEEFKKHVLPPFAVDIDRVTAIKPLPIVNGLIYVSESDLRHGKSFFRLRMIEQKNGGVVYFQL